MGGGFGGTSSGGYGGTTYGSGGGYGSGLYGNPRPQMTYEQYVAQQANRPTAAPASGGTGSADVLPMTSTPAPSAAPAPKPAWDLESSWAGFQGMDPKSQYAVLSSWGTPQNDIQKGIWDRMVSASGGPEGYRNWEAQASEMGGGGGRSVYSPSSGFLRGSEGKNAYIDPRMWGYSDDWLRQAQAADVRGTGQTTQQFFQNMLQQNPIPDWQKGTNYLPPWVA